jgi:two-component system, LuxR family, response regulator FixJ
VKQRPKVFVIDVDPTVSSSIESLLAAQSYEVMCFGSTEEFIAQHHPAHVGCVVIDLSVAGTCGCELIRHLHESRSLLSIVIVSGLIDSAIRFSREKVALPILMKACEAWSFLTMVEDAIDGSLKRDLVSTKIESSPVDWLRHFGPNVPAKEKILKLSPRQREVLSLLLGGDTLKEVAETLKISEHTVGDYVKGIYKNFTVSSRAELMALFISGRQP